MRIRKPQSGGMTGSQWDHLSCQNKIDPGCQSILQANAQARANLQDNMEAMRRGQMPKFDSKTGEICHRYQKEFTLMGRATRKKSPDHIY